MIGERLRAVLVADSSVTALVSSRIYRTRLPQRPTFPAVTYYHPGGQRTGSFGDTDHLPMTEVTFDVWAETASSANAVYEAIKDALDGFQGDADGAVVQSCMLRQPVDDTEAGGAGGVPVEAGSTLARLIMEFEVWANE